jgi:hypothetical protein
MEEGHMAFGYVVEDAVWWASIGGLALFEARNWWFWRTGPHPELVSRTVYLSRLHAVVALSFHLCMSINLHGNRPVPSVRWIFQLNALAVATMCRWTVLLAQEVDRIRWESEHVLGPYPDERRTFLSRGVTVTLCLVYVLGVVLTSVSVALDYAPILVAFYASIAVVALFVGTVVHRLAWELQAVIGKSRSCGEARFLVMRRRLRWFSAFCLFFGVLTAVLLMNTSRRCVEFTTLDSMFPADLETYNFAHNGNIWVHVPIAATMVLFWRTPTDAAVGVASDSSLTPVRPVRIAFRSDVS